MRTRKIDLINLTGFHYDGVVMRKEKFKDAKEFLLYCVNNIESIREAKSLTIVFDLDSPRPRKEVM